DDGDVNPQATRTAPNPKLKETRINPSLELPPQHLGWGGRLNGPADYFASSCMSCHSTAQYPNMRYQNPEFGHRVVHRGNPEWMLWFRNLKCGHRDLRHRAGFPQIPGHGESQSVTSRTDAAAP